MSSPFYFYLTPLCNIKKFIASRCLLDIFCVAAAANLLPSLSQTAVAVATHLNGLQPTVILLKEIITPARNALAGVFYSAQFICITKSIGWRNTIHLCAFLTNHLLAQIICVSIHNSIVHIQIICMLPYQFIWYTQIVWIVSYQFIWYRPINYIVGEGSPLPQKTVRMISGGETPPLQGIPRILWIGFTIHLGCFLLFVSFFKTV